MRPESRNSLRYYEGRVRASCPLKSALSYGLSTTRRGNFPRSDWPFRFGFIFGCSPYLLLTLKSADVNAVQQEQLAERLRLRLVPPAFQIGNGRVRDAGQSLHFALAEKGALAKAAKTFGGVAMDHGSPFAASEERASVSSQPRSSFSIFADNLEDCCLRLRSLSPSMKCGSVPSSQSSTSKPRICVIFS